MATVCEWFGLKTTQMIFAGLTSKQVVTVSSGFASKPAMTVFFGLASKPVATVSPVWPQNWWRQFLPIWPQNRRSVSWLSLKTKVVDGFSVWASKSTYSIW
jgi:hypothetical protein